ncbi:hypothetical protein GGR56DRAFT_235072 [Xylariaceae sp. FL0804]|nr:hypothetical protein GGR56DRAFT_235072 [Xylariaceae sp. FL0804]
MADRQPPRKRQKYKDSCTNCAVAKVKCGKEKPLCARCGERGLECSYELSYRYGRLPAAQARLSSGRYRGSSRGAHTRAELATAAAAASRSPGGPGPGPNPDPDPFLLDFGLSELQDVRLSKADYYPAGVVAASWTDSPRPCLDTAAAFSLSPACEVASTMTVPMLDFDYSPTPPTPPRPQHLKLAAATPTTASTTMSTADELQSSPGSGSGLGLHHYLAHHTGQQQQPAVDIASYASAHTDRGLACCRAPRDPSGAPWAWSECSPSPPPAHHHPKCRGSARDTGGAALGAHGGGGGGGGCVLQALAVLGALRGSSSSSDRSSSCCCHCDWRLSGMKTTTMTTTATTTTTAMMIAMMAQVRAMIGCDCFVVDHQLRIVLALIAFELMTTTRYPSPGAGAGTAEAVLDELQAVLEVVGLLLRRLGEVDDDSEERWPTKKKTPASTCQQLQPLSSAAMSREVFRQLEEDLRQRLRHISHRAMDVLRRI